MAKTKELESVESVLRKLPEKDLQEVWRVLYGNDTYNLELSEKCNKLSVKYNIELISCGFFCQEEQLRSKKIVRVGLFQQKLPLPLSTPARKVKLEMYTLASDAIKVAAKGGVKIFCLQQAWNMPYSFCHGEDMPWSEYSENAQNGPTTKTLQLLAEQYNMVIISPILERDDIYDDTIWNTAVVIDNHGNYLGKHRRNHIPKVENPNEPTYYCEGNTGHPVFETEFGKIAVNICYGRHYPLNWMGFAINGAEIVFNPCATAGEIHETLWGVEARNAAIANGYFVCTLNRLGTEIFEHDVITSEAKITHKNLGNFFGSSYISAPNGSRSQGLPRTKNGLLISDLDLNLCRQAKDQSGSQILQRLDMYKYILLKVVNNDFIPQVIRKKCN